MFKAALYISIIISITGMIFQLYRFKKDAHFFKEHKKKKGIGTFLNIKDFFLNSFLQIRLFKAGKIRWCFHFLLFLSFLYLVIVHAMHDVTSSIILNGYEPTIDPYQFLRNLTGILVLAACVTFIIRRYLKPGKFQDKSITNKGIFSIILIVGLIGSGFLLEASKIISEPVFMEMIDEYSDLAQEDELVDLKLFWQQNYNVVFDEMIDYEPEMLSENLENGEFLNEDYCMPCHSDLKSAFLSNFLAKNLRFAGNILNQYRTDTTFYIIHYILCMLLLICLPFSRLFHVLLIPFASASKNLTLDDFADDNAFINTISLHACTNCGFCSQVCSVNPNFQITENQDFLPHSKIETVKTMLKDSNAVNLWQLQAGNNGCTMCHNCTDICPSNIDLHSLWSVLNKKMITMGYIDNNEFIKTIPLKEWTKKKDIRAELNPIKELTSNLADSMNAFESCIQCTICTNVCPVVDYDSSQNDVGPHQVMNLLRLNKKHLATGTRMVWTCLTCYTCQENCPQQIQVADILLELRNSGSVSIDMIKKTTQKVYK